MPSVNISNLNIRVGADVSELSTATKQANRIVRQMADETRTSTERMTSLFTGAFAALGAFKAIDIGKDFIFDSIAEASDVETFRVQLEILLKSVEKANSLFADLSSFGLATPFESPELQQATKQLLAYGFTGEQVLPVLKSIGDVAAGTGASINDLAEILGRARSENRFMSEDLNRLTDRAIPIISTLARQLGLAEGEIRKMASEGKIGFAEVARAFADMTSAGGDFENMMLRMSQTTEGKLSTLNDDFRALKIEVGEGLLPAMNDLQDVVSQLLTGGRDIPIRDGVRELAETVTDAASGIAGAFQFVSSGFLVAELAALRTGEAVDVVFGSDQQQSFKTGADEIKKRLDDLQRSATQLMGITPPDAKMGVTVTPPQFAGIETILDDTAKQADEAAAAIAKLTEESKKFADSIRREYQDPIDAFRESVEKIAKAQKFGGIEEPTALAAIQGETDKLVASLTEAKNAMRELTNPSIEKGSQADIGARFNARFQAPQIDAKQLRAQLAAIVRDARFAVALGAVGGDGATAGEISKFDNPLGNLPTPFRSRPDAEQANELKQMIKAQEKQIQQAERLAQADRAILRTIATNTAKNANPITVKEFSA